MCRIIGILETPLVTKDLYWAQLECGIFLKAQLDENGGGFFKARVGLEMPCPIHQPELFERDFSKLVLQYGDLHNCGIVIGD